MAGEPVLGSELATGTVSDGDSVFSLDGGVTRRFTVDALAEYVKAKVKADLLDGYTLVFLTQSEYDALASEAPNTLYLITSSS